MAAGPIAERNQDATIYVGGLDEKVTDSILWDLFLQSGPVVNVHMPKDRITQSHQGYGFVEFMGEEDADYAIKIMNMIKLYGKPIRVNKASAHQKNLDVGANLFIGNLDPEVDEKLLYDTFSAFGVILQTPKIMRDPESGNCKGYAFINFASFDAADAAMEAMNGQYLCNRAISISYAFKKDSKGERHGSAAERLLAAQNPLSHADRPHQLFADAPPMMIPMIPPPPPPGSLSTLMHVPPPNMPPMGGMPMPMGQPPPPPMPGNFMPPHFMQPHMNQQRGMHHNMGPPDSNQQLPPHMMGGMHNFAMMGIPQGMVPQQHPPPPSMRPPGPDWRGAPPPPPRNAPPFAPIPPNNPPPPGGNVPPPPPPGPLGPPPPPSF